MCLSSALLPRLTQVPCKGPPPPSTEAQGTVISGTARLFALQGLLNQVTQAVVRPVPRPGRRGQHRAVGPSGEWGLRMGDPASCLPLLVWNLLELIRCPEDTTLGSLRLL